MTAAARRVALLVALLAGSVRAGTEVTLAPTVLVTRFPTDEPTDDPTPAPSPEPSPEPTPEPVRGRPALPIASRLAAGCRSPLVSLPPLRRLLSERAPHGVAVLPPHRREHPHRGGVGDRPAHGRGREPDRLPDGAGLRRGAGRRRICRVPRGHKRQLPRPGVLRQERAGLLLPGDDGGDVDGGRGRRKDAALLWERHGGAPDVQRRDAGVRASGGQVGGRRGAGGDGCRGRGRRRRPPLS